MGMGMGMYQRTGCRASGWESEERRHHGLVRGHEISMEHNDCRFLKSKRTVFMYFLIP